MKWAIIGAIICAIICLCAILGHPSDPIWYDFPQQEDKTK